MSTPSRLIDMMKHIQDKHQRLERDRLKVDKQRIKAEQIFRDVAKRCDELIANTDKQLSDKEEIDMLKETALKSHKAHALTVEQFRNVTLRQTMVEIELINILNLVVDLHFKELCERKEKGESSVKGQEKSDRLLRKFGKVHRKISKRRNVSKE